MTATYLLLSVAVLMPVIALSLIVLLRRARRVLAAAGLALLALVVLTTVFDTVIVGSGIVAYDSNRILGVRIGVAPIEDFSYPIAAAAALPALWLVLPRRRPAARVARGR